MKKNCYTTLGVHLYHEGQIGRLLNFLTPLIEYSDSVCFTSGNAGLLERAKRICQPCVADVKGIQVNNKWHDWSGYLALMQESIGRRLIICNDSIVLRRVVMGNSLKRFLDAVKLEERALVGELDTAKCSVDLNGWSSGCWISTYMFAISGFTVDVGALERAVEEDVSRVGADRDHFFNDYLQQRRKNLAADPESHKAKLGAMFFERRLTKCAIEAGVSLVDFCAGSRVRKLERILERFRDE